VDPKVQATSADINGKRLLLEGDKQPSHRPVTSDMLINKFQGQLDYKGKNGNDTMKATGDVRSSHTTGKKESNSQQWKTI
jgi:hypothetical protein